jgi:transposase
MSCFEAGRDGFWSHRYLEKQGLHNLVVDSSSIEVNRKARRKKTDKQDTHKLLTMLMRYDQGEKKAWSVVHVPRRALRGEVTEDLRTIFNTPDQRTAEQYLQQIVDKYAPIASQLANWLEDNIPEGLTVFDVPHKHRRQIHTVNMLERTSEEIKRRTRVVRIFPNSASCLRLVSAVLMEISENWETGRMYLNFDPD